MMMQAWSWSHDSLMSPFGLAGVLLVAVRTLYKSCTGTGHILDYLYPDLVFHIHHSPRKVNQIAIRSATSIIDHLTRAWLRLQALNSFRSTDP